MSIDLYDWRGTVGNLTVRYDQMERLVVVTTASERFVAAYRYKHGRLLGGMGALPEGTMDDIEYTLSKEGF